jgi:hypothetical protein
MTQVIGRVTHGFGQAQVNEEMEILSPRFRAGETDHFANPKFSLAEQDFPEKEAKRVFFE